MSRVSVITPCYNSVAFVSETIASVRRQSLGEWDMVVVDDGSSDGSAAAVESIAAEEPRLRLVRQPNGGVANARNNGFRAAASDAPYVLFLDADDCLEVNMLARLAKELDEHPDVVMVFCDFSRIDEQGCPFRSASEEHGPDDRYVPWGLGARRLQYNVAYTPFEAIFALAVIIPSISMIRRSAFEQAGSWDETFGHVFEDTDLFLRLALLGPVHFIPESLVRHRRHATNSTADLGRVNRQQAKLYSKWLADARLTATQRALVRRSWWFVNGRLGPLAGARAGAIRLARGDVRGAASFWAGALRRYTLSFIGWSPAAPGRAS